MMFGGILTVLVVTLFVAVLAAGAWAAAEKVRDWHLATHHAANSAPTLFPGGVVPNDTLQSVDLRPGEWITGTDAAPVLQPGTFYHASPGILYGSPWPPWAVDPDESLAERVNAITHNYDVAAARSAIERTIQTTREDDDAILSLDAMRPVLVRAKPEDV